MQFLPAFPMASQDAFHALGTVLGLGEGSLAGVIKENIAVAGLATSAGCAALAGVPPAATNATVVARLLAADGMRIAAMARMHELAYGVTGLSGPFPHPVNPVDPARIPGGSSSGCAVAVAAELADFAIGTDTGGSIRLPAACCAVVGLKPTFGSISREGVLPAHSTLDCVGIIARSVEVTREVLSAIGDVPSQTVATPRLMTLACEADEDVREGLALFLDRLGADIPPVDLPLFAEAFDAGLTIIAAEMAAEFGALGPDFVNVGSDVAERLRRALTITREAEAEARAIGARFAAGVDRLLGGDGFLILPTLPCLPPLIEAAADPLAQLRLTRLVRPFNVSGHPAITIPFDAGLPVPIGIQIIGPRGADFALCDLARQIAATLSPRLEN